MPLLPLPLPNELLSSVIARASRDNGLSSKRQIQDAFGDNRSYRSFLFGDALGRLALLSGQTPEKLLNEHTVFPYSTAFLPLQQKEEITKLALTNTGRGRLNFIAARVSAGALYRRVCVDCIKEDQRDLGVSYWRVTHQLPLCTFCETHNTRLQNTDVQLRGNSHCRDMTLPHQTKHQRFEVPLSEEVQRCLSAKSVLALKRPKEVITSRAEYRRRALDLGFSRPTGALAARALSTELEAFYGSDYLQSIDCSSKEDSPWPAFLCSETKMLEATTTKHLILSCFLERYVKVDTKAYRNYRPRQRRQIDFSVIDKLISERLEKKFENIYLANADLKISQILVDVDAKSVYSHHRSKLPMTTDWIDKIKMESSRRSSKSLHKNAVQSTTHQQSENKD